MKQVEYQPHAADSFMADEMLPCPCCGSDPELTFTGNDYTKSRSATIKCGKCRLQIKVGAIHGNAEWCAETVIAKWNKRTP